MSDCGNSEDVALILGEGRDGSGGDVFLILVCSSCVSKKDGGLAGYGAGGANVEYDTAEQFSATLFRFAGEKVHFIMAPVRVKLINAPDFDLSLPPRHHKATFGDAGDNWGLRDCRKREVVFDAELAERDDDRGHVDT